jgi:molybdate transport system substrate-binding protein
MDYVGQRNLLVPGTRVNLLRNTLVLIAPASNKAGLKIAPNFDLAGALGADKIAMANPDSVPAGKYGKSALEKLGVWSNVEKQVARAENVRAALALVSRGEAPFGIVYSTDALSDKGVRIVDTFPPDTYPPIVYPGALLVSGKSPAGKPLLDYLRSAPARGGWEKYGFGLAP